MPILTLVDTLGIQSFVFASSRLQDVTGGSWQVMQASKKDLLWVQDCVKDPEDILIGGGGNVMLQFASLSEAQQFAKLYSRKILNKAPGLEVAIVHQEYAQGQLAYGIRCAQIAIEREKLERVPQVPVLGLGVTATCRDTRLPATQLDKNNIPISEGVHQRRQYRDEQEAWWCRFMPDGWQSFSHGDGQSVRLAFPRDLDDMGRSRKDTSFMGVVHVDGNGIGQKIQAWLKDQIEEEAEDASVREQYVKISQKLDALVEDAFRAVVQRITAAIRCEGDGKKGSYVLRSAQLKQSFPLRGC